jgi:hypothetical protein
MYMLMDDAKRIKGNEPISQNEGSYFFYDNKIVPRIEIKASRCLVDLKNPLLYGIQSAFDGDPATSYVENTEDDLMQIEYSGIYLLGYINRIALINGYAQNKSLYMNNNRIKEIRRNRTNNALLDDNILSYQFIDTPNKPQFIIILDIYL